MEFYLRGVSMKKLLASLLTASILGMNTLPVLAQWDIADSYWASKEINKVVNDNILPVDEDGRFNPENTITRIQFVQGLLKVLSNENLDVTIPNTMSDVSVYDSYYDDVLRGQQLGVVYGYPDGTFKPNRNLLRSEVTSLMSHITKEKTTDMTVLSAFKDNQDIPDWATHCYTKAVSYGLYVNHPNLAYHEPNRELTRAEAAVLLARLSDMLNVVKDEYLGDNSAAADDDYEPIIEEPQEIVLGIEHLCVHRQAPNNTVTITNFKKSINQGNVVQIAFSEKFLSKKHKGGEIVNFYLPRDLYTVEGTKVLPEGTRFVAEIMDIQHPKIFNKKARVNLIFKHILLPDGSVIDITGKPFTKDGRLAEGPWVTFGKVLLYTITGGAVGTGVGMSMAFIPDPSRVGTALGIGIPVGCTVGMITGLITPGVNYKAKQGELIYLLLIDDLNVEQL